MVEATDRLTGRVRMDMVGAATEEAIMVEAITDTMTLPMGEDVDTRTLQVRHLSSSRRQVLLHTEPVVQYQCPCLVEEVTLPTQAVVFLHMQVVQVAILVATQVALGAMAREVHFHHLSQDVALRAHS